MTGRWFDTASDDREIEVGPGMAMPKKNQVAGVMGMNFKVGLFDDPQTFFVVVAAMVGLAAAILLLARLQRWI